ncbi:PP2C family protein-serine/threonine phosphatase [Sphaerimonospora mesophila]|uniref:PP2C family protein-serine/threonine phosphatase n=1 Tax=Sphaerimonospora mesophila TaxID=37483 RepID=UPI000B2E432F
MIQSLLDAVPGEIVWSTPIRNAAGEIVDFVTLAAGSEARDLHGRIGKELIGVRMLDAYPSVRGSSLWEGALRVMETGDPVELDRYEHEESVEGVPRLMIFRVRLARVGDGLLISWVRQDDEERLDTRLAHTERLGNLGWTRWSIGDGDVEWSDQLYVIHRLNPADGPLDLERYRAIVHPDDVSVFDGALRVLEEEDGPHEFEFRVRVGGNPRLIVARAEASRDSSGRLVEVHAVLQDITDWRRTADQLAAVSQRLEEESQLTARLQNIILPVQDEPFTVPGLRVAARYDPAETAPLGGDWFQAIRVDDDEALLAVGDIAGHGLPAASAMAKLRHAITGLAFAHHEPDQILVALNRLLRRMRPDVLATAVVAHYRSTDRVLTWCHAGHPPMLLVRGDTVERLHHPGVLLGVFDDVEYSCASIRLDPDDLLLMFTDGLIERPGRDLFEGLDALSATITEVVRAAPRDRLSTIMDGLVPSNTSDDTCILVARVTPNTLEVS